MVGTIYGGPPRGQSDTQLVPALMCSYAPLKRKLIQNPIIDFNMWKVLFIPPVRDQEGRRGLHLKGPIPEQRFGAPAWSSTLHPLTIF